MNKVDTVSLINMILPKPDTSKGSWGDSAFKDIFSVNNSSNTIKVFKLTDRSIHETGITPIKGDRFDKDRYKYYFLNEPYMIYAIADTNIINNIKANILNLFTGGMITDKPCKYIIISSLVYLTIE